MDTDGPSFLFYISCGVLRYSTMMRSAKGLAAQKWARRLAAAGRPAQSSRVDLDEVTGGENCSIYWTQSNTVPAELRQDQLVQRRPPAHWVLGIFDGGRQVRLRRGGALVWV